MYINKDTNKSHSSWCMGQLPTQAGIWGSCPLKLVYGAAAHSSQYIGQLPRTPIKFART
ncbi:hypothetical protein BT96DRAFT_408208 [Gymnopus androsaceus JB14]|uniref:Uncharacterized protein n=1 Tax=Gymnopus androsaceus JB14 TaxID=1447944 RepID=A0A6A4GTS1_9AGAR|nr:hypothetical protein BT96DRAFT_408208 [Gymnopus androsaceus JB14]